MALWVPQWLFCLWNFELAHAGSEDVAKPRFESRPDVEYELREYGIQAAVSESDPLGLG